MPFTKPFKKSFSNGDLIYGLTSERLAFAEEKIPPDYALTLPPLIDYYAATKFEVDLQRNPHIKAFKPEPKDQALFHAALRAHPKYRSVLKADATADNGCITYPKNSLSRKCKAMLNWITETQPDRHIHFILDNLNQYQVANKCHWSDFGPGSITGSELRWIYRNRFKARVQNGIQFWHHGEPVDPPWLTNPAIWKNYTIAAGPDYSESLLSLFGN